MKKVIILVLTLFAGVTLVKAQDVIIKLDGNEIIAKVTIVTPTEVKYKLHNDLNGPEYVIPKTDVFKIKYADGTQDGPFPTTAAKEQTKQPVPTFPPPDTKQQPFDSPNNGGGGLQQTKPYSSAPVAQDYRKGYVGVGIGGAFLLKKYNNANAGYQTNVNAGYKFGELIGITGMFITTSFGIDGMADKASAGLSGVFLGPLISFTQNGTIEYDIRPTLGFVSYKWEVGDFSITDGPVLGFGLGWTLRWNVSNLISLTGNVDYIYHAKFEKTEDKLSSTAIGIGVNFRFGK
jgi:hypothetical protein